MSDVPPYWIDPSISEFEVSINSVKKHEDQYHIHIEENVIRPAGGGQAGDKGRLSSRNKSITIHDTIGTAGEIVLVTDGPLVEGAKGKLEIDMNWRSSMMRNHTAEHLFVSIIKSWNKEVEVGELWIDGKHGSVELLGAALNHDTIFEAEHNVMMIIEQNLPVETEFVDSSSIDSSVRQREGLTEKHAKLRVVRVGEMDSSACSGIHVTQTGNIGFFKVLDVKTSIESTRVGFSTGMIAADLVSTLYNMALRRKYSYPFEMEQLGSVLDLAKQAVDDKQKMIEKTTHLLSSGSTVEKVADVTFIHENLPGYDATALKILANQLQVSGPTLILLFAPGRKSQVILRVNELPKEASEYIVKPMSDLGGRGGGKGDVYTGGFVDVENSMKLFEDLVSEVRKSIS